MNMTYALGYWLFEVQWIWICIKLSMNISLPIMYNIYFYIKCKFKICIFSYPPIKHIDNWVELDNWTTLVGMQCCPCIVQCWAIF
jgi:hypothetical protein